MKCRGLLVAVLMLVHAGCGGGGKQAAGVVPADLRDVERAGEGLVTTTFGAFPDRAPSWGRARTVLSILKTVWTKAKAATPALPSVQTGRVDAAIAALDTAITAQAQKDAVIAANAVGLAVPELFDFFHPDAPKEIVRMDAVFRQIGIDAHFQRFSDAGNDIKSLKTDWANSKAAVAMRTPTCHRVGGTATVAGEIDQSLT